jgi:hypothetical protein
VEIGSQPVFQDKGVFHIQSGSHSDAGNYLLEYESLVMVLGPGTKALCGEDSFDAEYQRLTHKDAKGSLSADGQLRLYLKADAGRMELINGGQSPEQPKADAPYPRYHKWIGKKVQSTLFETRE